MAGANCGRVALALALLAVMPGTGSAADVTSAFSELTRLVGDRVGPDPRAFRDCSQTPIAFLDSHVVTEENRWFSKWAFTWATVAIEGGTCIYLEKPERRGLSTYEARILMSAGSLDLANEPAAMCPKPDIRDFDTDIDRLEADGRGAGFTYSTSSIAAKGELAPFARIQRDFVARQKALFAAAVKHEGEQGSTGKRMLGISFELSRSGDFSSLQANVASTLAGHATNTFSGWLLHRPSGRILAFDDLFVDPQAMRELILVKARPRMSTRFKQIYVSERTEIERQRKEALIDERVLAVTDRTRSATWQVTLDRGDPCEPGLLVTFDGAWLAPNISDRPEARFTAASIRMLLKPEFRDALGQHVEKVPVEPAFSSETVARQFPALIEVSRQNLLPLAELQPDLVGCLGERPESLDADSPNPEQLQWMYNGLYRWRFAVHGDGTCVVLLYPEQRGLSREEGQALLSAAKRKLPFDESKLDPAFASEYPNDMAQTFGGFPAFERGSKDGVNYTIGFMGMDGALQPLDVIQRRSARDEIAAMAKEVLRHRPGADVKALSAKLRVNFVPGGRTAELAVLGVESRRSFADGQESVFFSSWMLHVPSAKLIGFDDLFVDPAAVRKRISEGYRRGIPSRMAFYAFPDREKEASAFHAAYRRAAYRLSAPTPEHFRDVRFGTLDASLLVYFSREPLARGDYAWNEVALKSLQPYLKSKYAHAFDPARRLQPATVEGVGTR